MNYEEETKQIKRNNSIAKLQLGSKNSNLLLKWRELKHHYNNNHNISLLLTFHTINKYNTHTQLIKSCWTETQHVNQFQPILLSTLEFYIVKQASMRTKEKIFNSTQKLIRLISPKKSTFSNRLRRYHGHAKTRRNKKKSTVLVLLWR